MTKKDISAVAIKALDILALALADSGHCWNDEQRKAYEEAIALLDENRTIETVH